MKKFTHTLLLLLLTSTLLYGQAFVTTWKTDNPGTSNDNEITIPTTGSGYDYSVDWGDGNTNNNVNGDMTHTYASAGTYTVAITGDFPRIYFNSYFSQIADAQKILSVDQWGDIEWASMEHAFSGCYNLEVNATDAPNLSDATSTKFMFGKASSLDSDLNNWDVSTISDMSAMFASATIFNGDISDWDVSSVVNFASMFSSTDMFNNDIGGWNVISGENFNAMFSSADGFNVNLNNWDVSKAKNIGAMFANTDLFNQPLDNWDVSNVTNMIQTFLGTKVFNQPIGNWDVSKVNNMKAMFQSASVFNQSLNDWDVSNVLSMEAMFEGARRFNADISDWNLIKVSNTKRMFIFADDFNQDLSDWDVSKVVLMDDMFNRALSFNSDISGWDVGAVTSMAGMFYSAPSFDKNLSDWDVSLVADMGEMFDESGLSTTSYDNTLIGWAVQTLQNGVELGATNAAYCNGAAARAILTSGPNNWIINDAGENCRPFITTWQTTSASEQITIPTSGAGYNYTVDWGDGNTNDNVMGDITHEYASAGTHTISISGDFPRIYFNDSGDKDKLMTIEQWGDIEWQSMDRSFNGCKNMTMPAIDNPNLNNVTSMTRMFAGCSSFNGNISNWDVSNVRSLNKTFSQATIFNQDIGSWDVSKVSNMVGLFSEAKAFNQNINAWDVSSVVYFNTMFYDARKFNQPLNNWDVTSANYMSSMFSRAVVFNQPLNNWDMSNVTDVNSMFSGATQFNQDIGNWDMSSVTNTEGMFYDARTFNQDIGQWDVSNVTMMASMFSRNISTGGTSAFNQDIGDWDVSKVTNMAFMFSNSSFNQDISDWDVSKVTTMTGMLNNSKLNTANYDKLLISWSALTLQSNVDLGAQGINFCLGSAARDILANGPNNWNIIDEGEHCVINFPDANFKAALIADNAINTNMDGEITFQEAEAFTGRMYIYNKSIADLTGIEAFTNIYRLSAGKNVISEVDLSKNVALTMLELNENDLTSIDLSNNTNLTSLSLDKNSLTSLDLSMNKKLITVSIAETGLTTIDLTQNTLLERITARNNDFSSIELGLLNELEVLDIRNNSLTQIDVSNLSNLELLAVSFNQLESIDLSNNGSLKEIQATDNLLSSLDVSNGNNSNIANSDFKLTNNPDLTCITVDDVAYAEANFTDIDATANFSTNCSNIETDILTFSFAEEAGSATVDASAHTVAVEVNAGTDLSILTPTFTISSGASVDQASGVAQDFRSAFVYTITAENPTATQAWTVNVEEENVAPTDITLDNSSIDETNAIGAVIGALSSTDGNATSSHTYTMIAGTGDTDNASFGISGGNLIAAESFDFETKTSYSVRVETNDGRGGTFSKAFTINITDLDGVAQSITFNELASVPLGSVPFDLTATASSGLAVTYSSSDESIATIDGNTVTILAIGTSTITAMQAGSEDYEAAENVSQELAVTAPDEEKQDQTITLAEIADKLKTDTAFDVTASASSELVVALSITGPATLDGITVTLDGTEGTVTITANQAGNDTFNPAPEVSTSFEVIEATEEKQDQTITLAEIADKLTTNVAFEVEASASSELVVALSIEGPATLDGTTVTLNGTEGTVTITANQTGNDSFNAAPEVSTSFEVTAPQAQVQTITFNTIENQFFEAGTLTLSAIASSGLEVNYKIVSGQATVSGNVVSFSDLGTVVVSANQAGDDDFLAADAVEQSFEIITVTGVDDIAEAMLIYPNPASDIITVQSQEADLQIRLLNTNGKEIMSIRPNVSNNISHLKRGVYFLRIANTKQITTHKIIKN